MSKYVGSKWKQSRHLNFSLLETGDELKKRAYGPGQHGQDRKRKPSEYGAQLAEKQKLRELYNINERQFRRLFLIAKKEKTVTGLAFFRILESRLDNLVYRMGFSRTRAGARQLVNHGHIKVNGKKVDIASYLCNVGDVITLKEDSPLKVVKESFEGKPTVPAYVTVDAEKFAGTFARLPERNELPKDINEAMIIEYYNRLL
ncbi:MAG: 30S ribosomal protein S4 [Bacilli bacterium]|jgi:small subunit ribosomal protein S4|nr:30S ribosomal protein S4 [Bacilli bacterium]MBR5750259.1 30S ribosomal protein S4 [Bacilli bacterium]MBR6226454.1 30S ribosomal protein S4 [Bacilli bacterium]